MEQIQDKLISIQIEREPTNMNVSKYELGFKVILLALVLPIIIFILAGGCKGDNLLHCLATTVFLFLIFCFSLLFFENTRQKSFEALKISLSGLFILFSAIHYFETKTIELEMIKQKDLVSFKLQNLSKNEFDRKASLDLSAYENSLDKGKEKNTEYLTVLQEAIIIFLIGIWTYIVLEMIPLLRTWYLHGMMMKELEEKNEKT